MKKIFTMLFFLLFGFILLPLFQKTSAQVVVKPNEVSIGTSHAFIISVVNEKNQPIIRLKLIVPKNIESATPTVKNGWTITTNKTDKTIEWTGGTIPAGQRDEFSLEAKMPNETATLLWKVYQTYEDGTVISWDKEPDGKKQVDEKNNAGPYSTTLIVDDVHKPETKQNKVSLQQSDLPLLFSSLAIIFSALTLITSFAILAKHNKK